MKRKNKIAGLFSLLLMFSLVIVGCPDMNTPEKEKPAETPAITVQPVGYNAFYEDTDYTPLTVVAEVKDGTLTYKWWYSPNEDKSAAELLNPTDGSLASYQPVFDDSYAEVSYFWVTITNTTPGNKTATINSNVVKIRLRHAGTAEKPVISANGQPQHRNYAKGYSTYQPLTVSIEPIEGTTVISYQWFKGTGTTAENGQPVSGEIGASFTPPINGMDAGVYYYYVVVTNFDDSIDGNKEASVTSTVAVINVLPASTWQYTDEWAAAFKAKLPEPSYYNQQGEKWEWPDLYTFWDGRKVLSAADWPERREELKMILQHYTYGYLPPKPTVNSVTYNADARTIAINYTYDGVTATSTSGAITWPTGDALNLYPAATGMPLSFGGNANYDAAKGYARMGAPNFSTQIATVYQSKMAADDYPSQIMREAWSTDLVLEAIERLNTLPDRGGMQYKIDPTKSTITGHSRGGKQAMVVAAFSKVSVAAPSSSGAYGVAPERFLRTIVLPTANRDEDNYNKGKGFYILTSARGASNNANAVPRYDWVRTAWADGKIDPAGIEYGPIQSIQNYEHGRFDSSASGNRTNQTVANWAGQRMKYFTLNNNLQLKTSENGFTDAGSIAQIPFDAHYLTALMANSTPERPRGIIITAGTDGDSWVNPEGSYWVFMVTRQLFKWLGYEDNAACFMDSPRGHTHTTWRRARQMDLCEYLWKGTALPDTRDLITANAGDTIPSVRQPTIPSFLQRDEDNGLVGRGSPFPFDYRSFADYQLIKTVPPMAGEKSIAQQATEYFQTHISQ